MNNNPLINWDSTTTAIKKIDADVVMVGRLGITGMFTW
jgi:hypothetical protein